MKIIRLWGVITFFVLGVLLALGWYLVAPMIIERGIESAGSEALGAKVEVGQIDLTLFPLGVEIDGLQVADPDQPMSNLFEVNKINFAVESSQLLWKKISIDELTIDGIQINTPRTSSGALQGGRATQKLSQEIASIDLPQMTDDDIKQLVDNADLITVKRLEKLKQTQAQMQTYWKSALDKEALEERSKALQSEFNRLKKRAKENKMNLLTDRKAWKKLKKNIDKEQKSLANLNKKLKADKKDLQQQIADVRQGPKDDLNAIMSNMGLGNGVSGLSDKFLGPQFTPWIEKVLSMTQGMTASENSTDNAPVYTTTRGHLVKFKDEQVFPDLLVKKISLNGKDTNWQLSGVGSDIGYFPWLVGKPAKLNLDIAGDGRANIAIVSNWSTAEKMLTQIDSSLADWKVSNMKLMQTDQGNWLVKSGQLNSTLKGEFSLEKVDLKLAVKLTNPNISEPEGLSGWQKTLANSLNQQKQISINVIATGSLKKPEIQIKSSIEKLFSQAIGAKVKEQAEKLKGKFSSKISERIGDLSSLDKLSGDFSQWTEQLKGNDEILDKLKAGI